MRAAITAEFTTTDEAERAVRRLKEAGVRVHGRMLVDLYSKNTRRGFRGIPASGDASGEGAQMGSFLNLFSIPDRNDPDEYFFRSHPDVYDRGGRLLVTVASGDAPAAENILRNSFALNVSTIFSQGNLT